MIADIKKSPGEFWEGYREKKTSWNFCWYMKKMREKERKRVEKKILEIA